MCRFCRSAFAICAAAILSGLVFSCTRTGDRGSGGGTGGGGIDTAEVLLAGRQAATPNAVLQAGEYPLWFQITSDGPVHIETVEAAVLSAALIPWPHAPHIRFTLAQGEDLLMAVNHSGFIRLSPQPGMSDQHPAGIGLYYVSGGEFWRRYTVGGLFLFDEKPAALLYRDDRFLDSDAPPPLPRLWTHLSATAEVPPAAPPTAPPVPALDAFAPEDGWNIDTLRLHNGYWHFRAVNKTGTRPEIIMFRTNDLSQTGERIALGEFQNAARPEPLSAAPAPLREMLAAVFAKTAADPGAMGAVAVISPDPEFPAVRNFSDSRENTQTLLGFYSNKSKGTGDQGLGIGVQVRSLITTDSKGAGWYAWAENDSGGAASTGRFSLPPLPEGFVYTGIGLSGDTVFASWEEQDGYSIGAAGFMALKLTALLK
jgi:hypothetical protein